MARREILADDLDGKEGTEDKPVLTWMVGVGPRNSFKTYTLDLREENYEKLTKALEPFLTNALPVEAPSRSQAVRGAARASAGATRVQGAKAPVTEKGHNAEYVREWLRSNDFGHLVKGQGRLSGEAIERFNEGSENKDDQYLGAKAAAEKGISPA